MRLSSLSTDYVRVPVAGEEDGTAADPTLGSALELAVVAVGVDPQSGDWHAGEWETDATTSPPIHYARLLVGPTGPLTLPKGFYTVWVRWTDNPEKPVLDAHGALKIF